MCEQPRVTCLYKDINVSGHVCVFEVSNMSLFLPIILGFETVLLRRYFYFFLFAQDKIIVGAVKIILFLIPFHNMYDC